MAIAVYGASGHTGRLVAQRLASQGNALVLGGRNRERIARATEQFAAAGEIRTADAKDQHALRELLSGVCAVVNCAPVGDAILRAAIDSGVHCVDGSGEQPLIRRVFEAHDQPARQRGVALVPAAGFDYALGDCLAHLVTGAVEPAEEVVVAYALEGAGVAQSSARGAVQSDHSGEVVYRDGSWHPPPLRVQRASFRFPAPIGQRPVTRYGSGEVLTLPRHTRVRNVTALVTSSTFAPHPALIGAFPYLRPAASLLLRTPLRRLARRAGPAPHEPGEEERRSGHFLIAVLAHGDNGQQARGALRGSDFHLLTALALAHAAERIAEDGFDQAGALAPAAAYDPAAFLDSLGAHGVSWERHPPA
jgi:short subunit dehydrogenase-like uncharacterized protein